MYASAIICDLYSVKEGLSEVPEEAEKTFFYGRPSFYREETPAEGLILYRTGNDGRVPVEEATPGVSGCAAGGV